MFGRLQSWATTILSTGEIAPTDAPAVRDRASCALWLQAVPIADPTSASEAIADLLDELHDSELAGTRYIEILEQLRPTILGLQAQLIEQLSGRGVPLQARVKESFFAVQRLWGQLARSYVRALRRATSR